jgi:hypothetical protein
MKVENISVPVLAYFESCLMPQIETSLGKAVTYAGLLLTMPQLEQKIQKIAPMIVNENGDIDLQKLQSVGTAVFEKVPKVEIADFDFDRNDFEKFISYLSMQG